MIGAKVALIQRVHQNDMVSLGHVGRYVPETSHALLHLCSLLEVHSCIFAPL